jgi:hypothetical protein
LARKFGSEVIVMKLLTPLLLAGLAAFPLVAAAQERVGVASAVVPDATAGMPGQTMRTLIAGADVIFNETIATGPNGQVQILFVDRSSLTIGPDTSMVIDEFAYDRNAGTGTLKATVSQGLLRYVGGAISKNDDAVKLRTPVATIGIRGGMAAVDVQQGGTTTAGFLYGKQLTVDAGQTVVIERPGFASTVSPGGTPTTPAPIGLGLLNALSKLGAQGAQGGGTANASTDTGAKGVAASNSENTAGSHDDAGKGNTPTAPKGLDVAEAGQSTGANTATQQGSVEQTANTLRSQNLGRSISVALSQTSTPATGFTDPATNFSGHIKNGILTASDGASTLIVPLGSGAFAIAAGAATTPFGSASGNGFFTTDGSFLFADLVGPGSARGTFFGGSAVNSNALKAKGETLSFDLQRDGALNAQLPFIRATTVKADGTDVAGAAVSPFLIRTGDSGQITAGSSVALQASLVIDGTGAAQHSAIVVGTGQFLTDNTPGDGATALAGSVRSTARLDATQAPTDTSSGFATVKTTSRQRFFGGGQIEGFALDQNAYTSGGVFTQGSAIERSASLADTAFGFTTAAVASSAPATTGARTAETLTGFAAGLGEPQSAAGNASYVVAGTTSIVKDTTTNRVAATVSLRSDPTIGNPSGFSTLELRYGGTGAAATSDSALIDDNRFAAVESHSATPATIDTVAAVVANDPQQAARTYLVTADVAPSAALLPAVAAGAGTPAIPAGQLCDCQFLKWGWWGGEIRQGTTDPNNSTVSRTDRFNLATWVAGQPTVQLPNTGTATFNGRAVAAIDNSGTRYVAAGSFNGIFDFGAQNGTVKINNLDSRNYTGAVTFAGGGYTATLNGVGVPGSPVAQAGFAAAGKANGAFFGPGAAETGGSFAVANVGGGSYQAAGVFAGKR